MASREAVIHVTMTDADQITARILIPDRLKEGARTQNNSISGHTITMTIKAQLVAHKVPVVTTQTRDMAMLLASKIGKEAVLMPEIRTDPSAILKDQATISNETIHGLARFLMSSHSIHIDIIDSKVRVNVPPTIDSMARVSAPPTIDSMVRVSAPPTIDSMARVSAPPTIDSMARVSAPPAIDMKVRVNAPPTIDMKVRVSAPPIIDSMVRVNAPPTIDLTDSHSALLKVATRGTVK
jgi:hypothetical protein